MLSSLACVPTVFVLFFSYPAGVHVTFFAVVRRAQHFVASALSFAFLCAFVISFSFAAVCSTLFVVHFCLHSGLPAFHWEVLQCKVLPGFRL